MTNVFKKLFFILEEAALIIGQTFFYIINRFFLFHKKTFLAFKSKKRNKKVKYINWVLNYDIMFNVKSIFLFCLINTFTCNFIEFRPI